MTENQKIWIAALRSGEYKQTRGKLRSNDLTGYCCLGVACELSKLGTFCGIYYETTVPSESSNRNTYIPVEVMKWLGITDWFKIKRLVQLNDIQDKTFSEIADFVESPEFQNA
jgi:hypothetical protein